MADIVGSRQLAPERLDRPFADPLVQRLFPPLATGVHWGLERTERALEALNDPHRSYWSIHVGGTNGKGSVTSTLASILTANGSRTGCYTSPHLCSFRERILVDAGPLAEETLLQYAEEVREVVVRFGLTFFEAVTVLAFHAFAREGVEVTTLEVGLGGRLDATNVVLPEVAAVTNIAMDHADYLGDTLSEIAIEKAGIIKPGVPFVTAEQDPALLAVIREVATERGAPFSRLLGETIRDVAVTPNHTTFSLSTRTWGDLEVRTPLVGHHQATNAALAVAILGELPDELRPDAAAILKGVGGVDYHGRDQVATVEGRTWLFDVAHNTAGIRSLVDTIDRLELPRPLIVLVGVLGDKDWRTMLPPLFSRADAAVLTQPPSAPEDRRWDPREAADAVESITLVRVVENFSEAVERAKERAGKGTVVVTGSVHTVGSAMQILGLEPLAGN